MTRWEYRAYNSDLKICDGIETANSFIELAVKLRQCNLQVLEAKAINEDANFAAIRLAKMRARVNKTDDVETIKLSTYRRNTSVIRKLVSTFIALFIKR